MVQFMSIKIMMKFKITGYDLQISESGAKGEFLRNVFGFGSSVELSEFNSTSILEINDNDDQSLAINSEAKFFILQKGKKVIEFNNKDGLGKKFILGIEDYDPNSKFTHESTKSLDESKNFIIGIRK